MASTVVELISNCFQTLVISLWWVYMLSSYCQVLMCTMTVYIRASAYST